MDLHAADAVGPVDARCRLVVGWGSEGRATESHFEDALAVERADASAPCLSGHARTVLATFERLPDWIVAAEYRRSMSSSAAASVTAIHLHPVKSCRRVEVDRAVVGPFGLEGDREWQVQGPDGQMMNQRKFPQLARVQPIPLDGGLRLQYDGLADLLVERPARSDSRGKTHFGPVSVADAGDEAAAWFEQVTGLPCRLTAMTSDYRRRVVVGTDLFQQEVSLADAAPILLVSAASHRFLLERSSEPFGIERFRPNIVVDGCAPWAEDRWQAVTCGEADIRFVVPCPRCAIPQIDQDTGERHREPALVLKRHRWCAQADSLPEALRPLIEGNGLFGMYGSVGPSGAVIGVGDSIVVSGEVNALIETQHA